MENKNDGSLPAEMMTRATPKTLREAIQNGIEAVELYPGFTNHGKLLVIENTVKDFLAQKFGTAFLRLDGHRFATDVIDELYEQLTQKPKP